MATSHHSTMVCFNNIMNIIHVHAWTVLYRKCCQYLKSQETSHLQWPLCPGIHDHYWGLMIPFVQIFLSILSSVKSIEISKNLHGLSSLMIIALFRIPMSHLVMDTLTQIQTTVVYLFTNDSTINSMTPIRICERAGTVGCRLSAVVTQDLVWGRRETAMTFIMFPFWQFIHSLVIEYQYH